MNRYIYTLLFIAAFMFFGGFVTGYVFTYHRLSSKIAHTLNELDKLTRELQEQHP